MNVYKVNRKVSNSAFIEKIVNSFGFNNPPIVDNENLTVFSNPENNSEIAINKDTSTIKYSKNLLMNPMIKPIKLVSVEEIFKKLEELITKRFPLTNGVKIRMERTEFEVLAGPRFVSSDKEKSNIVKIICSFEIDGYPVISAEGFPIIARFSTDGNLLNLSINMPLFNLVNIGNLESKPEAELQATDISRYKTIDIDGGKDYDLAESEERPVEVNIIGQYFGYLYSSKSNYLAPYAFFSGNSKLPSGPAVILLAVPALKEEEYYQ
jgi:hypothetical protein